MIPLDLGPYLITPGDHVIARRVESQRSRAAAARAAVTRIQNDPLRRQA
jgi:hypothetical protein